MEILGWHDTPLRSVMHSMTSVSRWPGVMCYGNGYLLWERVNKAGKTHKIPCVNRVWAGGCYEEMGLGEREGERDQWTLGVMAGGASGGGNLCTGMSRDRVSSGVVCDPDIDSHHHDMSSLSCGQLSSSVVHQAIMTQSSLTEFAQRNSLNES